MTLEKRIEAANKGNKAVLQELEQELLQAAMTGNADIVQKLIDVKGINLNARDKVGNTALAWAVQNSNDKVVQVLVAKPRCTEGYVEALSVAARLPKIGIVKILMKNLPATEYNDDDLVLLKDLAYLAAVNHEDEEIMQLLIEKFSATDKGVNVLNTALHYAAMGGCANLVRLLVEVKGIDLRVKEGGELTPLMRAAWRGFKDVVQVLVAKLLGTGEGVEVLEETFGHKRIRLNKPIAEALKQVDVKVLNEALVRAAGRGNVLTAQALRDAGDEVNLVKASEQVAVEILNEALVCAAGRDDIVTVQALVAELLKTDEGVEVLDETLKSSEGEDRKKLVQMLNNAVDNVAIEVLDKALVLAAQEGRKEVVKVLVAELLKTNEGVKFLNEALKSSEEEYHNKLVQMLNNAVGGFDIEVLSKALVRAAMSDHEEVVRLFVGVDGIDLNAIDKDGNTALIWAAIIGNENVVRLLIKAKANLEIQNNEGNTALELAGKHGHADVAQVLSEAVANLSKNEGSARLSVDISDDNLEGSEKIRSYSKGQFAACFASSAVFTAGAYGLFAQGVFPAMWGLYPVLAVGAIVGLVLAWALITPVQVGGDDVAKSVCNQHVLQEGHDATLGSA